MTSIFVLVLLLGRVVSADDAASMELPQCPKRMQEYLKKAVSRHARHRGIAMVAGYTGPDGQGNNCSTGAVAYPNKSNTSDPRHGYFSFGSFTKMWTASAILKLYEEGQLDIDSPAFPYMERAYRKATKSSLVKVFGSIIQNVTVRHLLTMRAGIGDYDEFPVQIKHPELDLGPAETVRLFGKKIRQGFMPGTCGAYSSMGYELLGLLLIGQSGAESWDKYNQNVWGDLFKDIRFSVHGVCSKYTDMPAQCAKCNKHGIPIENMSCTNGYTCGNLVARAEDVARFEWSLFNGKLLKKTTVEEMFITHKFGKPGKIGNAPCSSWNAGEPYGLGIEFGNPFGHKFGTLSFPGHNGATYGFLSWNIYDQSRGAAYVAGAATDQGGMPKGLWRDIHSNLPVHVVPVPTPPSHSMPIDVDSPTAHVIIVIVAFIVIMAICVGCRYARRRNMQRMRPASLLACDSRSSCQREVASEQHVKQEDHAMHSSDLA